MLRAAIVFFVIALLAMFLGAGNVAGISMELGRTLLIVFLILAVLSFLANMVSGGRSRPLALAAAVLLPFTAGSHPVKADQTATEKAQEQTDQAKVDANKTTRKAHKKARDKTGHKNVTKDASDAGKNASEQVGHDAKTTKEKVD